MFLYNRYDFLEVLRRLRKVPVSKDLFMSFEIGTEISSQISFKILTGMLLGPLDFVAEKNLFNDFIRANWLEKNRVRVTVFQEVREVIIRRWDGRSYLLCNRSKEIIKSISYNFRVQRQCYQ